MSQRVAKVESLIQHTVAQALREYLTPDIAAIVTVTRIDAAPDLRHAIVWIGTLGPESKQTDAFKHVLMCQRDIQAELARHITTKFVPRLNFKQDTGGAYAAEIEGLLRNL